MDKRRKYILTTEAAREVCTKCKFFRHWNPIGDGKCYYNLINEIEHTHDTPFRFLQIHGHCSEFRKHK